MGATTEDKLKAIDKEARSDVNKEVAEADKMPAPEATLQTLYEHIYVRGGEHQFMRGRTPDENYYYWSDGLKELSREKTKMDSACVS
ncbi:MAG: hypothetical protein Q9187_000514 [Circinaria calcarea]